MAGTAGSDRRIIELLEVEAPARDLDWLKKALQTAVELELATLPVYLSGMWSIERQSGDVFVLIDSVVREEMLHLGLACNMLKAIEGSPKLKDRVPDYPCPLPGGVRPDLTVYLAGLSKDSAAMYMDIERPEHPLARRTGAAHTIGDFYDAILAAFHSVQPTLSTSGQQKSGLGVQNPGGDPSFAFEPLDVVATIADVEKAIKTIKDQGEGTSKTPDAPFGDSGSELAHFYRFGEIFHGKKLIPVDGGFKFEGSSVPLPACFPVAKVPRGGYPHRQEVQDFNQVFTTVIVNLEAAWDGEGSDDKLQEAIDAMRELARKARAVMAIPLPDDPHQNFGPDFKVLA